MIAQYIPALLAALLAYGFSPQNIKEGIKSQLTVKNIAKKAAIITATGAACLIAHEYGHALTAQALGVPVDYVCVGNSPIECTPENAWLSLGNFHIAGATIGGITAVDTAKIAGLSAADQIKIFLAGPLAGLLAYFGIKYCTRGKWHNPINAIDNAANLLPMVLLYDSQNPVVLSDGARVALNIPTINTLLTNNHAAVTAYSSLLSLCAQLYSFWPHGEAYKADTKSSRMRRLLQSVKRFGQKISLASANLIFYYSAIPMRLDAVDNSKSAEAILPVVTKKSTESPKTSNYKALPNEKPTTENAIVAVKTIEASPSEQISSATESIMPISTATAASSKPSQEKMRPFSHAANPARANPSTHNEPTPTEILPAIKTSNHPENR